MSVCICMLYMYVIYVCYICVYKIVAGVRVGVSVYI